MNTRHLLSALSLLSVALLFALGSRMEDPRRLDDRAMAKVGGAQTTSTPIEAAGCYPPVGCEDSVMECNGLGATACGNNPRGKLEYSDESTTCDRRSETYRKTCVQSTAAAPQPHCRACTCHQVGNNCACDLNQAWTDIHGRQTCASS